VATLPVEFRALELYRQIHGIVKLMSAVYTGEVFVDTVTNEQRKRAAGAV
jgi:hypothetical protein